MRARHVIGISAVPAAAITALVSCNTQTPMEQLDGPGGGANIDLLPDQAVWNGVEEAVDLDVIVDRDAGQELFRELIVGIRQRHQDRPLDGLEQLSAADADPAHDVGVYALQRGGDAAFASARDKKVCRRNPREDIVSAKRTAASTFALSRGFLGRAGRMPMPQCDAIIP